LPRTLRFDAVLGEEGWHAPGRIEIDAAGGIARIGAATPSGPCVDIPGVAIPGIPNLHSHAFQRALAGHGEVRGASDDSFWTWREAMYDLALRVDPEQVEAIAAMAYAEMLEAGMTSVGEFHYLHHDPAGSAYADPAEMSHRVLAAAGTAGIAMTLLPVLYRHAGIGAGGRGVAAGARQRRFVHGVDAFVELLGALRSAPALAPGQRIGWAPHSLRAVAPDDLRAVREAWREGPVHIHAAEQTQEVDEVVAALGARPVQWLLDEAGLDRDWCVVHATHLTAGECEGLARSGAVAGLCPTTEASLGDGFFAAPDYLAAGGVFGIGSDSNLRIDPAEELRWLEWGQRLLRRRRNLLAEDRGAAGDPRRHVGLALFRAAVEGGAQALHQPAAGLRPGMRADIVVLDREHPQLLGHGLDSLLDAWVFASGSAAVQTVLVGGEVVVAEGRHVRRDAIERAFRRAMATLRSE